MTKMEFVGRAIQVSVAATLVSCILVMLLSTTMMIVKSSLDHWNRDYIQTNKEEIQLRLQDIEWHLSDLEKRVDDWPVEEIQ